MMETKHTPPNTPEPTTSSASCCAPTCCGDTPGAASEAPQDVAQDAPRSAEAVRTLVREKYAAIATNEERGCGPSCYGTDEIAMIGEGYDEVEGYAVETDLGLGCGLPTEQANIQPGDTVVDLGCGAGVDAFLARTLVGDAGRVIGVDMTPEMVEKARGHAARFGFENVSFLLGEIEALPLERETVDVVISNCVLNLVPDKAQAFAEIYRVLRPGAHFCISDVVIRGALPESVKQSGALYAGCVAGAMDEEAYLRLVRDAGFTDVRVVKAHEVEVPDAALLAEGVPADDLAAFRREGGAIMSITLYGEKSAG